MIRLTIKSNGNPIYIAPDNITAICDNQEGGAEVYSGHDFTLVRETAAEVARKVLEWRLARERYRAYTESAACDHNPISNDCWELSTNVARKLFELAGLKEDPNHDAG